MSHNWGEGAPWVDSGEDWGAIESVFPDPDWEEYADAQAGARRGRKEPLLAATDEEVRSRLDNNDQVQAHELRKNFFWVITGLLVATVVGSIVAMALYMISAWGDIKSEVMISWFAAVVANTIGLALVVATYLFPGRRAKKRRRKAK